MLLTEKRVVKKDFFFKLLSFHSHSQAVVKAHKYRMLLYSCFSHLKHHPCPSCFDAMRWLLWENLPSSVFVFRSAPFVKPSRPSDKHQSILIKLNTDKRPDRTSPCHKQKKKGYVSGCHRASVFLFRTGGFFVCVIVIPCDFLAA